MSLGSATNYQFVVNYPINNISSTPHRKSKSKMAGAPCATEDQGQTKSPHPRESLHHQHHLPLLSRMVSLSTNAAMLRAAIACSILLRAAEAGYAPKEKPKLPVGFCPKGTGTVTDTTGGECRARIVTRPFPLHVVI